MDSKNLNILEKSVLCYLMNNKDQSFTELSIDDFSDESNALVFGYIKKVYEKDKELDFVLMSEETKISFDKLVALRKHNISKMVYIERFSKLKENSKRTKLRETLSIAEQDFKLKDNTNEVILNLKNNIEAIEANGVSVEQNGEVVGEDFLEEFEHKRNSTKDISLDLGLKSLNDMATLEGGELVVIGARPSVGKSMLGEFLAYNLAQKYGPIPYFSREMTKIELFRKPVSRITGFSTKRIMNPKSLSEEEYEIAKYTIKELKKNNNLIYECEPIAWEEVCNRIIYYISKYKPRAIFIDYAQLYIDEVKFKTSVIGLFLKKLKDIANSYNIVIFALAQLNRESIRAGVRPTLVDLRESGDIEQTASTVWLLYRESMSKEGKEFAISSSPAIDVTEVIQAKGRNNGINKCVLKTYLELSKYEDLDRKETENYNEYLSVKKTNIPFLKEENQ